MKTIVAIDGTAASGKGTIGKAVAKYFNFAYLDTGLIYRAVAKLSLDQNNGKLSEEIAISVAESLTINDLDINGLRAGIISEAASKTAEFKKVREALKNFQKTFPEKYGSAVLDGRDIGTEIFPNANVKLYIDSSPRVRAERRYKDRILLEKETTFEKILQDLIERDERDSRRQHSPLRISEDAHLIDTTELSIEASIRNAIQFVKFKIENS